MAAEPQTLLDRLSANVPIELRECPQWVLWRMEPRKDKPTKVPYSPISGKRAKSTDPSTWSSFEQACQIYRQGVYAGLGFVFSAPDPYIGIDFDGCVEADVIQAAVLDLVRQLDSYSEFSQSGAGIHVIVRGHLPSGGRKSTAHRVELYEAGRFFVMTGDRLLDSPRAVHDRQAACTWIHRQLFGEAVAPEESALDTRSTATALGDSLLLEQMFASRHGAEIEALWRGDTSAYHYDHSAADLALCNHLAFWSRGDSAQMDRLFRQSGLMREKWDRKARVGETYGQGTIARAITRVSQTHIHTPGRSAENRRMETNDSSRTGVDTEELADPSTGASLPPIVINDRQLPSITAEALAALITANTRRAAQPLVYVRAGLLTRVVRDEQGEVMTQPLSEPAAKGLLARCAPGSGAVRTKRVASSWRTPSRLRRSCAICLRWAIGRIYPR